MDKIVKRLFLFMMCLVSISCQSVDLPVESTTIRTEPETVITLRSGTSENDDIEEPLKYKEYSALLELSNEVCEHVIKNDYEFIYNNYFTNDIVDKISLEKFKEMQNTVNNFFGKPKSYKKQQWYFIIRKGKLNFVESVKIIHHEKAVAYYLFHFEHNNSKKMTGWKNTLKMRIKLDVKKNNGKEI